MCGIVGICLSEPGPVGSYLVEMIDAIQHRGPDSTGFAVHGHESDVLRLSLRVFGDGVDPLALIATAGGAVEDVLETAGAEDRFMRVTVSGIEEDGVRRLADVLEGSGGVSVHGVGRGLTVVKDIGTAREVDARHSVSGLVGTHGVAICRLATESQVDVEHSHPFWARPFADVSIVHNGQITNYHRFRRLLEQRGYRFGTNNDSELIAVYIAVKMSEGTTLAEALAESVDELDGCFTYLIATREGIGLAKDKFAAKPIVITDRDGVTAMASEEVALRRVFPEEISSYSPGEREVITWPSSTPADSRHARSISA